MDKLATGHRFLLCLGSFTISCAKISGIESEVSVDTINEGGVNDRMIVLNTPKKKTGRLIIEHGIGRLNKLNDAMTNADTLGKHLSVPGMILVFSPKGDKVVRAYGYNSPVPVKWSVTEFDAKNSSIIIDKIEIMYQQMYEMTV